MHLAIARSLPPKYTHGDEGRPLWRLSVHGNGMSLYIVSPVLPDERSLEASFGGKVESKPYIVSEHLEKGVRFAFDIEANPVSNRRSDNGKSNRTADRGKGARVRWLAEQGVRNGFTLVEGTTRYDFDAIRLSRDKGASALVTVRYTGELEVTDVGTFRRALFNGIGKAKAFGCGLILLTGHVNAST